MAKIKWLNCITILLISFTCLNKYVASSVFDEIDDELELPSDLFKLNRVTEYKYYLQNGFPQFNVSNELVNIIKNGQSLGFDFAKQWHNILVETKPAASDAATCLKELGAIVAGLATGDLSSYKFFDSWGKIPAGMLRGNYHEFGNFDECVDIKKALPDQTHVNGKYCLAKLPVGSLVTSAPIGNRLIVNIGVCMPSSCSAAQFDIFYKMVIKTLLNLSIGADRAIISEKSCSIREKPPLKAWDWVAVVVLSILTFGMIFSSLYEYFTKAAGKKPNPTLSSFSVLSNMKQLLLVKPNVKSPNIIPCLNGIRVLSLIWIFLGHIFMFYIGMPHINVVELLNWVRSDFGMVLQATPYSVDTFFFLTGFLVAFIALKDMDRNNGKLNIPMMYLHRVIRLLPMVALAILIYPTLFKYLGNGPLWATNKNMNDLCYDNWWSTLLFVQNYVTPRQICLAHGWYLAVDMQLYIFAPLLLIILWKWQRKGVAAVVLIGILFVICLFTNIMVNDYSYHTKGVLAPGGRVFEKTYFVTHARTSPFIVGILFGYYMHKSKASRVQLSKLAVLIGWLVTLGIYSAIVFGLYPKANDRIDTTTLEEAFFWSLGRVAWPLGLSWIIFACVNDYAGPINHFLSAPIWQPLAKLSYSIYIWHFLLVEFNATRFKVNTNFSDYDMTLQYWGVFGWSLLLSTYMHLAFEAPILNLANIFIPKPSKAKPAIPSTSTTKLIEPKNEITIESQEKANESELQLNESKDIDANKTTQNESQ